MAIPVCSSASRSSSQCMIITTYASTSWIMPSTAFKEALGFVLWSIRARRCCILYLRSNMRFCGTISMISRMGFKQFHSLARISQSNEKLLVSFTKDHGRDIKHTPLLKAVSASRPLSVSSNKMRAYRSRTSASIRGWSLQF